MPSSIIPPPIETNPQGEPRRVGVEVEFHGLDSRAAAEVVRELYGGRVEEVDGHRYNIEGTEYGSFTVELDSTYAHASEAGGSEAGLTDRINAGLANLAGQVSGLWLPTEICAPPVPLARLPELQGLIERLRERGALGTRANPIYGFGTQLNVEIAQDTADYVTRHLKAYLILSEWLRSDIDVDPTRRVLPFIDPFPRRYALKVVDPDYRPDLGTLIDDYLAENPTRNRELDMLPLFADLDEDRVEQGLAGKSMKIKKRPTFHYRLPNSLVDDPQWGGVVEEWNRWVRVEQLAINEERLARAGRAYISHYSGNPLSGWAEWIRALMQ